VLQQPVRQYVFVPVLLSSVRASSLDPPGLVVGIVHEGVLGQEHEVHNDQYSQADGEHNPHQIVVAEQQRSGQERRREGR
jgi:hypothetical protein